MPAKWSIEDLLNLSVEEFDEVNRRRERWYAESVLDEGRLEQLMTIDDLESVLASHSLVYPMVRVVQNGKRVPVEVFTTASGAEPEAVQYVDNLKLYKCFRNGASVVIRDLHRYWAPLTRLSWDLTRELGCAVTVNGYLTPRNEQAFKPHFDYHDIIVVQVAGSKEWAEFDVNANLPLDDNNWRFIRESVDPALGENPVQIRSHHLSPGDVLFVPRGGSHAVRSHDDVTFHLTLELQQWTHFDVLDALRKNVSRAPALRDSLEFGRRDPGILAPEAVDEAVDRLRKFAADGPADDLGWTIYKDSHRDLFESPLMLVSQYECLHSLDQETKLVRRPDMIYALCDRGASVQLRLRHIVVNFPAAHREVIERALSGNHVSARSCSEEGNLDLALKAVRVLVAEGVLVPATSTPHQNSPVSEPEGELLWSQ